MPFGLAEERELVARLGAGEPIVEVVGDPALAEFVREVLGVESGHLLAVTRGGEVDRQEVAGPGRAIDVAERTGRPQLGLLGLLDLGPGRLDCVELDLQSAIAGRDLGADLALGLELDDPFLLAAGDLDLRCGDEVDVVLADCLAEVTGSPRAAPVRGRGRCRSGPRARRGALPLRNPGSFTSQEVVA